MIDCIRGTLTEKQPNSVVIECYGLGYRVMAPLTVTERLPSVGEVAFLLTELVVREDSQTLFGFLTAQERQLFQRLIKVSGIGTKTALAMMSAMNLDELLGALSAEDIGRLSRTPGIGAKTAERLIVDFRGSPILLEARVPASIDNDTEQALAALGYKKAEIGKALKQLKPQEGETTADKVRAALRILSGR